MHEQNKNCLSVSTTKRQETLRALSNRIETLAPSPPCIHTHPSQPRSRIHICQDLVVVAMVIFDVVVVVFLWLIAALVDATLSDVATAFYIGIYAHTQTHTHDIAIIIAYHPYSLE